METLTTNITAQVINHYAALCEAVPLYPIQNEHEYEVKKYGIKKHVF
jgi:hypothetical protein